MAVPTGLSVGYPQFRPLHMWNGGSGLTWQYRAWNPSGPAVGADSIWYETVRFANFHTENVVWKGPDGANTPGPGPSGFWFTSCPAAGTVIAPGETVDCTIRCWIGAAFPGGTPVALGHTWRWASDAPSTTRTTTLRGNIYRDELNPSVIAIGSQISVPGSSWGVSSYPSYTAGTVPVQMSGGSPLGRTNVDVADLLAAGFTFAAGQLVGWLALCSKHVPTTSTSNSKGYVFTRGTWGNGYHAAPFGDTIEWDPGPIPAATPAPSLPTARWISSSGPLSTYNPTPQRWSHTLFLFDAQRISSTVQPPVNLGGGWYQWAAFPVILEGTGTATPQDITIDESFGSGANDNLTNPWYHQSYPRRILNLRLGPADIAVRRGPYLGLRR